MIRSYQEVVLTRSTIGYGVIECVDGSLSVHMTDLQGTCFVDMEVLSLLTEPTLRGLMEDALNVGSVIALDVGMLGAMYLAKRDHYDLQVTLEGHTPCTFRSPQLDAYIISFIADVVQPRLRVGYYSGTSDLTFRFEQWIKWVNAQSLTRKYSRLGCNLG